MPGFHLTRSTNPTEMVSWSDHGRIPLQPGSHSYGSAKYSMAHDADVGREFKIEGSEALALALVLLWTKLLKHEEHVWDWGIESL